MSFREPLCLSLLSVAVLFCAAQTGRAEADDKGAAAYAPALIGEEPLIPAQFHGVWDANLRWCETESDMRWYIGSNMIGWADSVGEARRVVKRGSRFVILFVSVLSDGDPWEGQVKLALSPDDSELTVRLPDASFTRYRCSEKATDR